MKRYKIGDVADDLEKRIRELEAIHSERRRNEPRETKEWVLIAIDGRCASGKTTLAGCLKQQLSCELVHMDDFFLRPEQRTKERLLEPGGNVDAERMLSEVIKPLLAGKDASYHPYDCHTGSFAAPVFLSNKGKKTLLIEGAYSCRPDLWDFYDLHIFLTVDKETQKKRIAARNGATAAVQFAERWIPLEEQYFQAYQIKERCELCYELQD